MQCVAVGGLKEMVYQRKKTDKLVANQSFLTEKLYKLAYILKPLPKADPIRTILTC